MDDVGAGWPDPIEPGVPSVPHEEGLHWLRWSATGAWTVAEWYPTEKAWGFPSQSELMRPTWAARLEYLGQATPPRR